MILSDLSESGPDAQLTLADQPQSPVVPHVDITASDQNEHWTLSPSLMPCFGLRGPISDREVDAQSHHAAFFLLAPLVPQPVVLELSPKVGVRAVRFEETHGEERDVTLDSGADESCLPLSFQRIGKREGREIPLCDAQGNAIPRRGRRKAEVRTPDVSFIECWTIANVTQPLLAFGKLLCASWNCGNNPQGVFSLWRDDGETVHSVPVFFRNNSLWVRSERFPRPGQPSQTFLKSHLLRSCLHCLITCPRSHPACVA
jgi:hypothetical protein